MMDSEKEKKDELDLLVRRKRIEGRLSKVEYTRMMALGKELYGWISPQDKRITERSEDGAKPDQGEVKSDQGAADQGEVKSDQGAAE